jgi:hypothetical protein
LGSAGDGDDWLTFHTHLEDLGWQVVIFDAVPRLDGDSIETALPSVDGIDLAVVVVARSDRRVDLLTSRRLNHLVGVLQGQLGFGRVLVLTENEIESFLHGSGVTEVRYDRGNIRARFPQVGALLEDLLDGSEPPDRSPPFEEGRSIWHRVGFVEDGVPPEMLVSGGVLLFLVVVLIVTAWQFAGGAASSSGGDDGPSAGTETDDAVILGDAPDPAGPEATIGSNGESGALPASCTIDTSDGMVLGDVVPCEGIGGLRVEGNSGPWHQQLGSVVADPGVVGHVELEGDSPPVTKPVTAAEEVVVLDGVQIGVRAVHLQFSADGQQVRFRSATGRGDQQAVLTFSLEL